MPNLPPLRTVRESSATAGASPATGSPHGPRATELTFLQQQHGTAHLPPMPGMPTSAQNLLAELLHYDLITTDEIPKFLQAVGDRLKQLTTRQMGVSALLHVGFLTAYQAERVLSGSTASLVYGPYRVCDRLNGGTVGIVFLATHASLKRKVALKVLPEDASIPSMVSVRFRTEMELLARIAHPNVVGVYDSGRLPSMDGHPPMHYAALELVLGGDLEQYIYAKGRQEIANACEFARQIASGLAAAHAQNLVHRDLKPSNVLLTTDGRAKVTDFGLARHSASTLTPAGTLVGSIEFMAPEQASDSTIAGPPSDIYALGATLFWMLTGELPYPQFTKLSEAVHALRNSAPRRVRDLLPNFPDALDKLITRMLARNPGQRPTAAQLIEDLRFYSAPTNHPLIRNAPEKFGNNQAEHEQLRLAMGLLQDALVSREALARDAALAVLTALSKASEHVGESQGRQRRHQEYVRVLSTKLSRSPGWSAFLDSANVDEVVKCVGCRNVGMLAIPESVWRKPGPLSRETLGILEKHTILGCDVIDALMKHHGESLPFLRTARGIVRHHHEKWDGTGYPDRLARESIPLGARMIALAEAYDALRRPFDNNPGLTHVDAVNGLMSESKGHFDPAVVDAFVNVNDQFDRIFLTIAD